LRSHFIKPASYTYNTARVYEVIGGLFWLYTMFGRIIFRRFGESYRLRLQSDNPDRVNAEVFGNKVCSFYMEKLEEI
jgi:hypothetical protein